MNSIKLLVADLAGTTVNDNGGIVNQAFQKALSLYNYSYSADQINQFMGMPKPLAIESIITKFSGSKPRALAVSVMHQNFVEIMIDYYKNDPDVAEVEGTSEIFLYLKSKNIKVAINTGFSKDITSVIIDRMEWKKNGLIDEVISSDEVPNGRPFPDMINELMRRLNISDPKSVCKIGDTSTDLKEGFNANCGMVVGVYQGAYSKEQLEKYSHTHLIPNITYLKDLL